MFISIKSFMCLVKFCSCLYVEAEQFFLSLFLNFFVVDIWMRSSPLDFLECWLIQKLLIFMCGIWNAVDIILNSTAYNDSSGNSPRFCRTLSSRQRWFNLVSKVIHFICFSYNTTLARALRTVLDYNGDNWLPCFSL